MHPTIDVRGRGNGKVLERLLRPIQTTTGPLRVLYRHTHFQVFVITF